VAHDCLSSRSLPALLLAWLYSYFSQYYIPPGAKTVLWNNQRFNKQETHDCLFVYRKWNLVMTKDQITARHKPHLVAHMHIIDLENKKRRNVDNFCGVDDGCLACVNRNDDISAFCSDLHYSFNTSGKCGHLFLTWNVSFSLWEWTGLWQLFSRFISELKFCSLMQMTWSSAHLFISWQYF